MASTRSRGRPFWAGAGVGAAFSISLALALSLITPLEQDGPAAAGQTNGSQTTGIQTSSGLSDEDQPSGAAFAELGDDDAAASAGTDDASSSPPPSASSPTAPLEDVASEAPEAPETAPAPDVVAANGAVDGAQEASPEAVSPDAPPAPVEPSAEVSSVEGAPPADEPAPIEVAAAPAEPDPSPAPETSDAAGEASAPGEDTTSDGVKVAIAEPEAEPAPPPIAAPSVSLSDFQIDGAPPFQAYSEEFEGDASEPFLSIVLLGVGESSEDLDELLLLPGPLTVVLTPDTEGLEDVTLDLRDAGFEVLLGLNAAAVSGGAAGPAETAAARMDAIDEAMGVAAIGAAMDEPEVADAVVLAAQSRGFSLLDVSSPGGGAGYRLAKSRNVPAAPNGRRFDEIRTSAMVFQALERAAFDARRTGVFVVTGETTKDVMTGVRRWMNVKANKTINVAPLSVAIDKFGDQ